MKGKLTIHKNRTDYSINLGDDSSMCPVLNINIDPVDFMDAITGKGYVDCNFTLYETKEFIGKKLEIKREELSTKEFLTKKMSHEAFIDKCIKPLEINGWKASYSDLNNHHKYHNNIVEITFCRYV